MFSRKIRSKIFTVVCFGLSSIVLIPLASIIIFLIVEGAGRMDLELLTADEPPPGFGSGGIKNAIIGTLTITAIATLIASPISIFASIYLAFSKKSKLTEFIYIATNTLQSIPAIVVGLIVYSWVVKTTGSFSLLSGSIALAIMMLPYIIISTVEVLKLLPKTTLEASYALGASFTKTVFKIALPSVIPGVITGVILSLARVIGEAAPLFFTAFGNPYATLNPLEPSAALPLTIFKFAITPYDNWRELAWAASLLLILIIVVLNIIGKWVSKRSAIQ